ncbi:hypothetical protein NLI96_g9198 [Meripilus lineatus]|uniref:CCHC-type domain-containing protein n=1 Tax=Meripilus lineatus TaxID=2056292 RepID=A0AAD5V156_9APHY|nr:hypothetical protein NLI96_g9198 [Physisporinus lineatus]
MTTTPPATFNCYDCLHIFESREVTDNHYETDKDNYFVCQSQPCPNRLSGPVSVHIDPWGVPILPEQADRIRRRHPKGHFEEKPSEQEVEDLLLTPSPATPTMADTTASPTIIEISISDIHKAFDAVPSLASDGRNFLLWFERVQHSVMCLDLDSLLTEAPTAATTAVARKVRLAMFGKMDNGIFMLARRSDTPHELLAFLNTRFNAQTEAIKANARAKMYAIRCNQDSEILKHLDRLSKQHERLADMGVTLADAEYIAIITVSIPPSFRPIIDQEQKGVEKMNEMGKEFKGTEWKNRSLNADTVLAALRAEALARLPLGRSSKSEGDSANAAAGARGKGRGRSGSTSSSGSVDKTFDPASITCYQCGGIGHKANRCPSPKDILKKRSSNSLTSTSPGSSSGNNASATSAPKANQSKAPTPSAHVTFVTEATTVEDDLWASTATDPHFPLFGASCEVDCASLDDIANISDFYPTTTITTRTSSPNAPSLSKPKIEGEPKRMKTRLARVIAKGLPRFSVKPIASFLRIGKVRGGVLDFGAGKGEVAPGDRGLWTVDREN